jgi:hypothetical protein
MLDLFIMVNVGRQSDMQVDSRQLCSVVGRLQLCHV